MRTTKLHFTGMTATDAIRRVYGFQLSPFGKVKAKRNGIGETSQTAGGLFNRGVTLE